MQSTTKDPWLAGVYEPFQGLRDFYNFGSYLKAWVKPNLLKDLETVFEGSRSFWDQERMPAGSPGRGDFVLATALFATFDHLGSFITSSESDPISPSANVARVAEQLPSLMDLSAIIAQMARNSITHVAWPQTAIPMDGFRWAFGLTFGASSDLRRHDNLFLNNWHRDGLQRPPLRVLKLKLNVHVLRLQLEQWVDAADLASRVRPEAFDRVKSLSIHAGNPYGTATEKYTELVKKGSKSSPGAGAPRSGPDTGWQALYRQIKNLCAESERLGCWRNEEFQMPKARDYGGNVLPGLEAEKRKRSIYEMLLKKPTTALPAQ